MSDKTKQILAMVVIGAFTIAIALTGWSLYFHHYCTGYADEKLRTNAAFINDPFYAYTTYYNACLSNHGLQELEQTQLVMPLSLIHPNEVMTTLSHGLLLFTYYEQQGNKLRNDMSVANSTYTRNPQIALGGNLAIVLVEGRLWAIDPAPTIILSLE